MEVEDNAFLALRTAGGGFAWLHASWSEWKNLFSFEVTLRDAKFEIIGLGGSYGPERLTLLRDGTDARPARRSRAGSGRRATTAGPLEIADVLAELDGEPRSGAGIDDAVAVFRIIDEAYRPASCGRRSASTKASTPCATPRRRPRSGSGTTRSTA